MIKIKCDYLCGAVAVPTDIIDKYLKLAPAASFKVLLFILRNPDGAANAEQIAMCTGLAPVDVEDCLLFWEGNGVIAIDGKFNEEAVNADMGNAKIAWQSTSRQTSRLPAAELPSVRKIMVSLGSTLRGHLSPT